jgi:hypothetical protein
MQGPIPVAAGAPAGAPRETRAGLALAVAWLLLASLGCVSSLALIFTPEVLANASIITIPLFVSGWGSVIGAIRTRARPMPGPVIGTLIGGAVGLVVGAIGLGVTYMVVWPA